ncbi:MAG TPA: GntR family transcriptional regulator [Gryllotalpicola sp.]
MARVTPNVPLSEQIAEQLRRRIASGEFPVGARLPTELELTRELGVSRNSVREALRSLVHAGLLRARAGDGTYVAATSELAPTLARRLELDAAADVAEVRLLLEREGARLAAVRATDAQLAGLRQILAARDAARDFVGYAAADIAFHHALLEASGNVLLAELYRGTGGIEESVLRITPFDSDFAVFSVTALELDRAHHTVLAAIDAHDADAAATASDRMVRLAQGFAPAAGDAGEQGR